MTACFVIRLLAGFCENRICAGGSGRRRCRRFESDSGSVTDGNAIILFPEGTRTRDGKLQPARSGIGLTVIKSQAPVVPCRVFGTYEAFGRHHKLPRPHRVAVKYGRVMDFAVLRAEAKSCPKPRLKEIYQEVATQIMDAISKLEPCEDKEQFP